jgi:apolipoprotein N-acyltransferase
MERLAGRFILLWGWQRLLIAFLAGGLAVLAQAPYDFFVVGFISFPILVWLLDGASPGPGAGILRRQQPAFAIGWWFGFGYFLTGLWWIGSALLVEAESFAWALPFAVLGVPIILAFFYAFATALAHSLWSEGIGRIAALAFAFGLSEWLRTFLFTGFPWNAIGYAAMPVPLLMQSVSVVGLVGMSALAVFVFSMPALVANRRHLRLGLALGALICVLHVGFGAYRLSQAGQQDQETLAVRVVQPSILMSEKWDSNELEEIFATLMRLSAEPPAAGRAAPKLILWPETSVPFIFTDRPDALAAIGAMLSEGQMLMAGAVRTEAGTERQPARDYNSVVAIDHRGEIVGAVDKVHLVPFGEYLPFASALDRIGLKQIVAGPMNFSPGAVRQAIVLPNGLSVVPFICYEIIFPQLVAVDVTSANIIVNVTNDAWFGNTPGPYQHFRQAQVRAVETGLPLVRAANTGISGAVDPYGRVLDALAINTRGYFDVELPIPPRSRGPALPNNMIGLVIVAAFGLMASGAAVASRFFSAAP